MKRQSHRAAFVDLLLLLMGWIATSRSVTRATTSVFSFLVGPRRRNRWFATTMQQQQQQRRIPNPVVSFLPCGAAPFGRRWYSPWQRFSTVSSSLSSSSATIPIATNTTNDTESNNNDNYDNEILYRELQWLAAEIRKHDALYYGDRRTNNDSHNSINDGTDLAAATTGMMITDDEYDALCQREAEICLWHPQLRQRLERAVGGAHATRYGGRVGAVVDDPEEEDATAVVVAAEEDAAAEEENAIPTTTAMVRTKRRHLKPMLSLDNVHNTDQLVAWLERIYKKMSMSTFVTNQTSSRPNDTDAAALLSVTILTEPKLDGLSLNLLYQRRPVDDDTNDETVVDDHHTHTHTTTTTWQLQWASTRGDGRQGHDVTHAVRSIVPPQIIVSNEYYFKNNSSNRTEDDALLEVRGEVVLPQSVFQQHRRRHESTSASNNNNNNNNHSTTTTTTVFANARNAAAGILLRKETFVATPQQQTRNESSGTTVQVDNDDDDLSSKLVFYAYDLNLPNTSDNDEQLDSLEARTVLQSMGFSVPLPYVTTTLTRSSDDDDDNTNETTTRWNESDLSSMLDYYNALRTHREKNDSTETAVTATTTTTTPLIWGDYDMDGCVHKVVDHHLKQLLGYSNRAPRWAVAHKFPPTAAVTRVLDIQVQVGRTGALTPIAVLEPVQVGGVTIQRATMHNFGHMQHILGGGNNHDRIPRGQSVLVRRAGEVIPQVVSIVGEQRLEGGKFNEEDEGAIISLAAPTKCPACGSKVIVDAVTKTSSNRTASATTDTKNLSLGQVIRCGGPPLLCPPRAVSALQHAYSRDALDVSGLSEARIQQLMDANLLRLPGDIFALVKETEKLDMIAKLDGWGAKSARNLVAAADRVATQGVSLARFIYSLGIRFAGVHSSSQIAKLYGTVNAFLGDVEMAGKQDFDERDSGGQNSTSFEILRDESESTKGIGPALLSGLVAFSKEKELVQAARQLADIITVHRDDSLVLEVSIPGQESSDVSSHNYKPLLGLSVVFTGSLPGMSRSLAQNTAKQMGATATPSTISKATGLVVFGDKGGKKLQEASNLGIKTMDASEFMALVQTFKEKEA